MIKYYDGTVFNVDASAIVNTVNCVGVMGAGIALEFMLRYPDMYLDYEKKCDDKRIMTGKVDYYRNEDGMVIINFPTKWHFKYPSKLTWIEQGLKDFVQTYKQYDLDSVAFPRLGTSKGGLNWSEVKILMEKYLSDLDITVYICLDNLGYAEGIEKAMLERFNALEPAELKKIAKLNSKQIDNIRSRMPYKKFWHISETESVGIKTYSNLFRYFYEMATQKKGIQEQTTLFDI